LPHQWQTLLLLALLVALAWLSPHTGAKNQEYAYIGPGAGFAFLGSFLTILASFFLTLVSLCSWPFRMIWRSVRRRKGFRQAHVRKVIFLGLDGLDPRLAERFMAEDKLPNLQRLKEQGTYRRLRTTFPSLSPVAWSTFATGVNPARHNIFDFLNQSLLQQEFMDRDGFCESGAGGFRFRGPVWKCAVRASHSGNC
jgi:hypothetical protein